MVSSAAMTLCMHPRMHDAFIADRQTAQNATLGQFLLSPLPINFTDGIYVLAQSGMAGQSLEDPSGGTSPVKTHPSEPRQVL